MPIAARVLVGVAGFTLLVGTIFSAVSATVLPRATNRGLTRMVARATRAVFSLWVGRSASYERRDRVMALLGPATLFNLLAAWLVLTVIAFGAIDLALGLHSEKAALELSGSSVFTLGTTAPRTVVSSLVSYAEAAIGLLLVALLITYLPSIYQAFSRREVGVNLLRARAGDPPRVPNLLIRFYRIDGGEARLTELWRTWETWFADVEETHTTFAVLPYFRSPQPAQSWITAAGVLLDSAAMWVSVVDHPIDPDAQLCIRTGYLTLRRVAATLNIRSDEDPDPGDPISVARDEWDEAVTELEAEGLPLVEDRDGAWRAWAGWRVNYDTVLLSLARSVEAPVAPWVSDRSPIWMRDRRRWLPRRNAG